MNLKLKGDDFLKIKLSKIMGTNNSYQFKTKLDESIQVDKNQMKSIDFLTQQYMESIRMILSGALVPEEILNGNVKQSEPLPDVSENFLIKKDFQKAQQDCDYLLSKLISFVPSEIPDELKLIADCNIQIADQYLLNKGVNDDEDKMLLYCAALIKGYSTVFKEKVEKENLNKTKEAYFEDVLNSRPETKSLILLLGAKTSVAVATLSDITNLNYELVFKICDEFEHSRFIDITSLENGKIKICFVTDFGKEFYDYVKKM